METILHYEHGPLYLPHYEVSMWSFNLNQRDNFTKDGMKIHVITSFDFL